MDITRVLRLVSTLWLDRAGVAIIALSVGMAHAGLDSWTVVGSPTVGSAKVNVFKLVNDPTDASVRYAVGDRGIFKSIDGGATWSAINTGIVATPAGYVAADDLVVDPKNPNTLYAAAWAAVQKSVDGGASWTVIGQPSNWHITALAIDPVNTSNLYGATNSGVWKSVNGGASWSNMAGSSATEYSVSIDPLNPSILYVANGNGAFKFVASAVGDTSTKIIDGIYNDPIYGYQVSAIAADPQRAGTVYAATGSGMYKSTNGGTTWVASNTCYPDNAGNPVYLLSASSIAFDPSDSSIVYAGTGRGLFRSADGAAHWTQAKVNSINVGKIVVDLSAPRTIYTSGIGIAAYTYPVAASMPLPPPPSAQSAFTVPTGQLPKAAVQVSATGTYGNASLRVTLDIVKVLQAGFAASTAYNVYVVAMVPGALLGSASPVLFVKPKAPGNWGPLQFPIAAFLENVAQSAVNNQVIIDILTNTDISLLAGAEIYIGYGTDDQEMLAAGRYRGVYKVQ